MKKYSTLLTLLLPLFLYSQTDLSGTISGDLTLDIAGNPYTIISNVTVDNGVTLTVESGVTVQFDASTRLYINGSIDASAAVFTSSSGSPASGDWDYIQVGDASWSGGAVFTDCSLSYGSKLYLYDGSASFTNCTINHFALSGIEVLAAGSLNINGGSLNSVGSNGVILREGSSAVITDGDFSNAGKALTMEGSTTATVNGLSIATSLWPIWFDGPGTLTLSGIVNLTGNTNDKIYVNHGSNLNDWSLPAVDIPYYFNSNYTVNNSGSLAIADNELQFNSGRILYVNGDLAGDGATFTSAASSPAAGDWNYIQVGNATSTGSATLSNCQISYASKFFVKNGTATLDICTIENMSLYGIETASTGSLNLSNSTLNGSGDSGLLARAGSEATLNNVTVSNFTKGAVINSSSTIDLTDCSINSCNYPVWYDGAGGLTFNGTVALTGNTNDLIYINHSNNSNDWILPEAAIPYYLPSNYTVNNGGSLSAGGNMLSINADRTLTVLGTLTGDGAEFTSAAASPADGDWNYIQVGNNTSAGSLNLNNSQISYADEFYVYNGTAMLTNCTLENIQFYGADVAANGILLMTNSNLTGNGSRGLFARTGSNSTLTSVTISNFTDGLYIENGATVNMTDCNINTCAWPVHYVGPGSLILNGSNDLTGNTNDAINVSHTSNSNAWVLPETDLPFQFNSNYTVSDGGSFDIGGNTLEFPANANLYIYGTMTGDGATLTSTTYSETSGWWSLLQVGNSSYSGSVTLSNSTLQYFSRPYIQNGNMTLTGCTLIHNTRGAEVLGNGTLNMEDCLVSSIGDIGIYARNGSVSNLNNTQIEHYTDGVYIEQGASVNMTDCTITNCEWPIYYQGPGSLTISGTHDFSGNTNQAAYVAFYSHSNHWTIPHLEIPYYFYSSLTVNDGAIFEITSGNVLKFVWGAQLVINGTLIADADPDDFIYFTSIYDDNWGGDTNNDGSDSAPGSSQWYGVIFNDSSHDAACLMDRCKLRYAGYGNTGGISMYNASPTIDACELTNNYYGVIMQYDSNPVFTNNVIGSSDMTPIAMSFEADPIFSDNSFSFSDNAYDAIGLIGGTLTANATLSKRSVTDIPNVTYLLLSKITVPADLSLTINKGIVIKGYSNSHYFEIHGTLTANATSDSMIVFTSVKDDNYGNPGDTNKDGTQSSPAVGDWGGFFFTPESDTLSIIDHCRIKYAYLPNFYYNNESLWYYSAIATYSARPTISNNIIENATYGVVCYHDSDPVIENNEMINISSTPFAISVTANPTFTGNTFTNAGYNALGLLGGYASVNGTLYQRTVAGYENITYFLLSDLTINNGSYIDIEPGIVIKNNTNVSIIVDGGLIIAGTADNEIVLTSIKDDNIGNPLDTNGDGNGSMPDWGNWYGIRYNETSDDSYCLIDQSQIKYGGNGNYGAVSFTNASGAVQNSVISGSYYYGVWCNGQSSPLIQNVTIENCRLDPIAMSLKANPQFSGISFTANGSQGIFILEGTLSSDAALAQRDVAGISNIAYILQNLTISSNALLTLEPGVVLKFQNYGYIRVQGALSAVGTAEDNIILTSIYDDSVSGDTNNDANNTGPGAGNWDGVFFYDSSDDSLNVVKNCQINYSGRSSYAFESNYYNGSLRFSNAYADIDSCLIQQSSTNAVGIYGSANPLIHNTQMYSISYEPVYMSMFADPTFSNNEVLNAGRLSIGVHAETWSQNDSIPVRNFAGFDNITYTLWGQYTINTGTTITIPEGIVIKEPWNTGNFIVNGELQVEGTEENPVVFTFISDDDYGNPPDTNQDGGGSSPVIQGGIWLTFNDVSDDASVIDHAVFRYKDWGMGTNTASPSITNNLFEHLNQGIGSNGTSEPVITDNIFNDLVYYPLRISLVSYPAATENNLISGTTWKGISIISETLAQDVLLPKRSFGGIENISYIFDNYTVGTGATLTIEPGVVCKFLDSRGLTVYKGLMAQGGATFDSTIVFTSIKDDYYGGDTNSNGAADVPYNYIWYGIVFGSQSLDPLCNLQHCIINHAGYQWGNQQGGVTAFSANPTVQYCSFYNDYWGVNAYGAANPVINYCDFTAIAYEAVHNHDQSFVINAENNWWGDNSGPTHIDNPGGTGEPVSDSVDYDPWLTDGAMNPRMGDVSLNGAIQAFDASLILQYTVGNIDLNEIQQLAADVSGNGGADAITAYDASLILQYVVGLIHSFPAEELYFESPLHFTETKLQLDDQNVNQGDVFEMPVYLDHATGLTAMEATLTYDPDLLVLLSVEPVGDAAGMNFISNSNEEEGSLKLALAGVQSLQNELQVFKVTFQAATDISGQISTPISISRFLAHEDDLTSISKSGNILIQGTPEKFALHPAYPNPFNPDTVIGFDLPKDTDLTLVVYDMMGRPVTDLMSGHVKAGYHMIKWNANAYASGVYFIKLVTAEYSESQKVMLLK